MVATDGDIGNLVVKLFHSNSFVNVVVVINFEKEQSKQAIAVTRGVSSSDMMGGFERLHCPHHLRQAQGDICLRINCLQTEI